MAYRDAFEKKFSEADRAEHLRLIKEAYKYYVKNDVRDALAFGALSLINKYLQVAKLPKEEDAMFIAALYLISRHPFSFANHTSKQEFAEQFGIKATSLDWYSENITEKLGLIRIYDYRHFPYYIEPEGIINSVILSVVRLTVEELMVRTLLGVETFNEDEAIDGIVDRLVERLKIVPNVFKQEIRRIVSEYMSQEIKKYI
ncbi:MAG: hypothetical protein ACUVXA_07360 [Candidatus Jordarchaeum sp.]|uniref:hypothetical protein n=1 Tax=Candidatus Jordarchaeum sp. TaxID=2823881 RepID=UPI00404B033A